MTCIAGIALPSGEVWIGGDSAATNSHSQQTVHVDEKIFLVRNASGDEFLGGRQLAQLTRRSREARNNPALSEEEIIEELIDKALQKIPPVQE